MHNREKDLDDEKARSKSKMAQLRDEEENRDSLKEKLKAQEGDLQALLRREEQLSAQNNYVTDLENESKQRIE